MTGPGPGNIYEPTDRTWNFTMPQAYKQSRRCPKKRQDLPLYIDTSRLSEGVQLAVCPVLTAVYLPAPRPAGPAGSAQRVMISGECKTELL